MLNFLKKLHLFFKVAEPFYCPPAIPGECSMYLKSMCMLLILGRMFHKCQLGQFWCVSFLYSCWFSFWLFHPLSRMGCWTLLVLNVENIQQFDYDVPARGFLCIMFGVLSASWPLSAIFFFKCFSASHTFFSVLHSIDTNVRSFIAILRSLRLCSIFPPSFFFVLFRWASLFICFQVHCLLHPAIAFFHWIFILVILFSISKVTI